jgi:hypothetical protein
MKPFDLKKALAGDPVIMQDGTPVKIAGYNPAAKHSQCVLFWDANGTARGATELGKVGYVDMLFMAPTERKEWVVRVANPTDHTDSFIAGPYKTYDFAKDVFNSKREGWATIHEITITE